MNYASLKAAVESYTLRTDLPFDTLLNLAESDIAPQVVHWRGEKTIQLNIGGDKRITVPPDYIKGRYLSVNGTEAHPTSIFSPKTVNGEVTFYRTGDQFQLQYVGEFGVAELTYYARIEPIKSNYPTNWLIENFPQVYLSAVLIKAYHHLRDDEAKKSETIELQNALSALAADHKNGENIVGNIKFGGSTW